MLSLGLGVVAHLKDGVTTEQASADVARIVELGTEAADMDNPNYAGAVMPLQEYYVGDAPAARRRTRGKHAAGMACGADAAGECAEHGVIGAV